jgi:hypothetical protein
MTDDTGMIQHANFIVPNYHEGYSIDDNARALIVSTHLAELELGNGEALTLVSQLYGLPAPLAGRKRIGRQSWPHFVGVGNGVGSL